MQKKPFYFPTATKAIAFLGLFIVFYLALTNIAGLFGLVWLYSTIPSLPNVVSPNDSTPAPMSGLMTIFQSITPLQFFIYGLLAILAYICACAIGYFLEKAVPKKPIKKNK